MWTNIIACAMVALAVGGAVTYIALSKRKGKKCIGCPYACSCSSGACRPETDATFKEK